MEGNPRAADAGTPAPATTETTRLLSTEGHLRALGLGALIYGGFIFFFIFGLMRETKLWRGLGPVSWVFISWAGVQIPAGVGLFLLKRWSRPILLAVSWVGIFIDIMLIMGMNVYGLAWMFVHLGGFYMLINKEGSLVLSDDYQRRIVTDRMASVRPMLLSPFLWIPILSVVFLKVFILRMTP